MIIIIKINSVSFLKGGGNPVNAIQKFPNANRFKKCQTIAELPLADQITVWEMRKLAAGYRHDLNMNRQVIEGFSKSRANRAGAALILLMDYLVDHLSQIFGINCLCNPGITQDDRLILEICSMCETDFGVDQSFRLTEIVSPSHSTIVSSLVKEFYQAMSEAGLYFRSSSRQIEHQQPEKFSCLVPANGKLH